jgi:hypothetical protein
VAVLAGGSEARAATCPAGAWVDLMVGSYHVEPQRHFDDFNPGVGAECAWSDEWAGAAGYFRNSLDRPSFYAGALYWPRVARWRALRFGAVGGIISGYNYGSLGLGATNRTGPILAPAAMTNVGPVGANLFLIPPIHADHLPFTLGLQLKVRFR